MLSMLAKFLKLLNGDAAPGQVAVGFAFALFWGLTPFFSLHNLIILLVVFVTRTNLSAFFLGAAIWALVAFLVDPFAIDLGEWLLAHPDLQVTWTTMYQSDVWRGFKFNHTLLMGGFAISFLAFLPVYFLSLGLIKVYRHKVMAWFEKLKITKILKASKFYRVYEKLED